MHAEIHPALWRYVFYEGNYSTRLAEENAQWAEICIRYQGAISRSSVVWTAANIVFFALGIQKLGDKWDKLFE